jgi:hypothetical protein
MPELTKTLLIQSLDEWGRYGEVFERQPAAERIAFLQEQGFASLHDMLAHVGAWWEEAGSVIGDALEGRQGATRTYNLDEFNATALARFKETPEAELLAWYEAQRQQMLALLSSLTDEQMKISRVRNWLEAVILEHLKEHGVAAPRFLIIDTLQREWGGCVECFNALAPEQQTAFLKKQGFGLFRDVIAHVLAWWEEGIRIIESSSDADPCAVADVDIFNAAAVARFAVLPESEVLAEFERTRLTLVNLADSLPGEVISKANLQEWFRADVMRHYFEHAA